MNTATNEGPSRVRDVVCGMTIDPTKAAAISEHKGETYYFCAPICRTRFDASTERYIHT